MKKILFTLAVVALSTLCCSAQEEIGVWTLTPKVGLNIARMTNPDIYVDGGDEKMEYGGKLALAAGVEAEYQWTSRMALAAELLYSNQGYSLKDNSAFRDGTATLHCLNVPLTLKCYLAPNLAFRVGLQPGFALGSRIEEDAHMGGDNWAHISNTNTWFRTFDLSFPMGLSYNIGAFEIDARYNLGLVNATEIEAVKIYNRVLQLTIGYRFSLY